MNATRVLLPLSLPHLYRGTVAHQSRDLPITHARTAVFHGPSSGAIRIAASECPLPRSYLPRTLVRSHLLRHLHFLGRYRPRGEKTAARWIRCTLARVWLRNPTFPHRPIHDTSKVKHYGLLGAIIVSDLTPIPVSRRRRERTDFDPRQSGNEKVAPMTELGVSYRFTPT